MLFTILNFFSLAIIPFSHAISQEELAKHLGPNAQIIDLTEKKTTWEQAAEILKQNPHLDGLILKSNELGNKSHTRGFFAALAAHEHLKFLDLSSNQLDAKVFKKIAKTIQKNHSLQVLSLGGNTPAYTGVHLFFNSLENNQNIKYIDISHTVIPAAAVHQFYKKLNKTNIEEINLSYCQLNFYHLKDFLGSISSTLTSADITGNPILEEAGLVNFSPEKTYDLKAAGYVQKMHNRKTDQPIFKYGQI